MSSQPVTITKINLIARHFDDTLAFYRLLGVEIPEVYGVPAETRHAPANNGSTSFAIDNQTLAHIYNAGWRTGTAENAVLLVAQLPSRDAVDATYTTVTQAGYQAIQPPYDTFWGSRFAIVADPEGNSVGLESPSEESKRWLPPQNSPNP
jgi:uncharacterized glyoxalase superfamily protein PhnB